MVYHFTNSLTVIPVIPGTPFRRAPSPGALYRPFEPAEDPYRTAARAQIQSTTQSSLSIACSVLVSVGMAAGAQEATELFIPIGQSPDLSNKVTVIGTIESVDAAGSTLVVKTDSGSATAAITEKTRIFLDRSRRKEPNRYGAFEDLEKGARVEVLYEGRTRATAGAAEWVKVEAAP